MEYWGEEKEHKTGEELKHKRGEEKEHKKEGEYWFAKNWQVESPVLGHQLEMTMHHRHG